MIEPLFLGVDGGGSKCKARLVDAAGRFLGEGVAGPANAFQDGDGARDSMLDSARRALAAAGLPGTELHRLVVGAGLAGVNIPRVHDDMQCWQHPFARLYLATDIHIACLGAHGREEGAVIVAGTGSIGYSFRDGIGTALGGHGFPCGDQGSGAWLGLEGTRAVLRAIDGLGPATALVEQFEAQLDSGSDGIVDALANASQRDYGSLAPLVIESAERGDRVARVIVREGAAYLSDMAAKLLAAAEDSLCILGGLGERMRPWMRPEIVERMVAPLGQPDEGAVLLARSRYLQVART